MFFEITNEIIDEELIVQKQKLDDKLTHFMGNAKQRDDILVIGIRF